MEMDKEMKRQLLLSGMLILLISSTLFLWFDSFSFQTYTKITDEQLCYSYNDESLKIDGYELFYKNEVLQTGGARIEGLDVKKNDKVIMTVSINDNHVLTFNQTVKVDNQVIYFNYKEIEEKISIQDITSIPLKIEIQRNKKKVYSTEIEMSQTELKTYMGSNKNYSISNGYLGDSWFKAGYFHCIDNDLHEKYPDMTIDYTYLKDQETEDYTRFIHINAKTEEFINGLTEVYFFDEENSLIDKGIIVFITLKGEDEFTFKIDLKPTINEGDKK